MPTVIIAYHQHTFTMRRERRFGTIENTDLTIHSPSKHHALVLVLRPFESLASPVLPVRKILRTLEDNMLGAFESGLAKCAFGHNIESVKEIGKIYASEERS